MQIAVGFLLMACALSFAHEGHDGHGAIKDGKLQSKDGVTYLDAGEDIQWADKKLKRKVTEKNQVLYQYVGDITNRSSTEDVKDRFLFLKAPGGQLLKAFSFDHAGEYPDPLIVQSPDLSDVINIPKGADFPIKWDAKKPGSLMKIIVEVRTRDGVLKGRLNASTTDDGEFSIPSRLLSQLPEGQAKIAMKRIWLGGCHPFGNEKEMLGIRTVASVVGEARIVE